MNLMMLLDMAAADAGERIAVSCAGRHLGVAGLHAAAGRAAARVRASGVAHLALLDEASPALPVALFAAAWAGVPFVPLSYRRTEAEVHELLDRIAPCLVVTDEARVRALAGRPGVTAVARSDWLARAGAGPAPGAADWADDPEAHAVLLFTSGTTGTPKAAVLRHRHLVSYVLGSVEFASAGEAEATLVSVPPYHVAGVAALLSALYAGRRVVQLPAFDAAGWLALARAERVTHAFVVPTMLARLVDALEAGADSAPPHLRALAYGGGRMPLRVIERALALLPGVDFTGAYGLTETSSTIAVLGPAEHRAAAASADPGARRRLGCAGRPIPGVEVEVRDASGRRLAPGESGEIHVRGEQVAGEYLERGSALDADGWFATRDGGWLDEEGYLFLEGRIDDVIVRGGENLSPGEIEEALCAHPAVADCAVVGVPSEQWGETVGAAIVAVPGARPGEEALRDWVRARLRSSRVPERIAFVDALPYNETGKLLRRAVRETLAAGGSC